jgi:hypothetical protein
VKKNGGEKLSTLNSRKCSKCKETKKSGDFYVSLSPLHDGKLPFCKICTRKKLDFTKIDSVTDTLRMIDRPFIKFLWDSTFEQGYEVGKDVFGLYMKNIGMKQYRELTWKDSEFTNETNTPDVSKVSNDGIVDLDLLKPTIEVIKKWGKNYEPEDYFKLEDFYIKMIDANKIETPQDETYLKKLAVISLKMDKELEAGRYAQVKQLGDLFSKYMADSKFRAMDQNDASKTGGLRTFSQIYAEVEKDEFIPPWEHFRKIKGLKQDIVDKTIMFILNYTLKLNKVSQFTEPPQNTPDVEEE